MFYILGSGSNFMQLQVGTKFAITVLK